MVLLKKIKIIFWWRLCVKFLMLVEVVIIAGLIGNQAKEILKIKN
jgi:hypothetical protein